MARLKPGVSRTEAQVRTRQVMDQLQQSRGEAKQQETLQLEDGSQGFNTMRPTFAQPLLVLMAVVGVVLLVACANLANLLLAKAQTRSREFAVRLSIGASRARLIRQLMTECLLLAAGGGAGGLLLSFWIKRTLLAYLNAGRSAAASLVVTTDMRVLAFCVALSFGTVLIFGLIPARQATRIDLLPGLTEAAGSDAGFRGAWMRRALVVLQIALSLTVVFAAGLHTHLKRTTNGGSWLQSRSCHCIES